jgi:enoyl-CoA hydratase/carnithine racemase
MWEELTRAGAALRDDTEVKVLVVRGAGPSFSSGLDLGETTGDGFLAQLAALPDSQSHQALATVKQCQQAFTWMRDAPYVSIAAVHGAAFGAGFQLALACDIRIVASEARIGLREARLGVIPDLGATAVLPGLIGCERALDLVLSARELSGDDAVAWGIALRAVPASRLAEEVEQYARVLSAIPPAVLKYGKAATYAPDMRTSLDIAATGQVHCVRESFGPVINGT